eukprot:maker-scaffold18_size714446-snap-gene-5.22 protein:Tk08486 transcript:maker-scaffold18_size714446-snap-gene-5.22-mRNA-1 annotation:"secreted signaling factor wnt4"
MVDPPDQMCNNMKDSLIKKQIKFCKRNPTFMDSVRMGALRALDECQFQFRSRRWNCSTLEDKLNDDLDAMKSHLESSNFQEGNFNNAAVDFSGPSGMDDDEEEDEPQIENNETGGDHVPNRISVPLPVPNGNNGTQQPIQPAISVGQMIDINPIENKRERKNKNGNKRGRKKGRKGRKDKKDKLTDMYGPYPLVSPGTREMAFVHAISSAGVAHALTKACSAGELENCGCDRSLRGTSPEGFEWSGCSDNVDFGVSFSRTFVDARDRRKSRKKNHAQPLMNLHNNEVGRKLLERNMKVECKCHGVSGSCELKTCWRSVASFRLIGEKLKEKFDDAQAVQQKKKRGRRMLLPRFRRFRPHTDTDLVYLKDSPDYCDYDPAKGSLGTQGRECNPRSKGLDGCGMMCCNRSFVTRQEKREERCKCKFHWCCFVECEKCTREVEVSTCK